MSSEEDMRIYRYYASRTSEGSRYLDESHGRREEEGEDLGLDEPFFSYDG